MKARPRRRTDRVSLTLPVWVLGKETTGEEFVDEARTLNISRYGATIVLDRKLAPMQHITLRHYVAQTEANARVVGQIGGQPHGYVYGVAFLDQTQNLWNIVFPPLTESEKAVLRVLLECKECQGREVAYLNELEAEVFEANRAVSRPCQSCNAWTLWNQVHPEALAERNLGLWPPMAAPESSAARTPRSPNKRKDVRVRLKQMTACIRQPGFGEESVRVDNVSRGGFRFLSAKTYYQGSRIEVAIPYVPGAGNIFVPARIVRSEELPGSELKQYGVSYAKTHKD